MDVAEVSHGQTGASEPGGARVRELLRRCAGTHDRAERAALLSRVANELDRAAEEHKTPEGADSDTRELIAGLHGQAVMARYVATLERKDRAHHASRGSRSA